jgi:hypothetical protein
MSKTYEITVIGGKSRQTKETDRMKRNGLKPQRYFSIKLSEQQRASENGLRVRGQEKSFGMAIFERQHSSWFQDISEELEGEKFNAVNKRTKNDKEIHDSKLTEYGMPGEIKTLKFEPFYITDAAGNIQKRYDAVKKAEVDAIHTLRPVFIKDGEELETAYERERQSMYNRGLFVDMSTTGDDEEVVKGDDDE